jgi:hypothetical protein
MNCNKCNERTNAGMHLICKAKGNVKIEDGSYENPPIWCPKTNPSIGVYKEVLMRRRSFK